MCWDSSRWKFGVDIVLDDVCFSVLGKSDSLGTRNSLGWGITRNKSRLLGGREVSPSRTWTYIHPADCQSGTGEDDRLVDREDFSPSSIAFNLVGLKLDC